MFRGPVILLCLSVILVMVGKIGSFDLDYYFMRSSNVLVDCDSEEFNFACSAKCKTKYTCIFGKCFCVVNEKNKANTKIDFKHNNVIYTKDKQVESVEYYSAENSDDRMDENTALRHHIAHFCENLDLARECIHKCIKLGKSAFCGKDHICYCGYKSSYPTDDTKVDAENMYLAFQDLYAKYFGSTERNVFHKAFIK